MENWDDTEQTDITTLEGVDRLVEEIFQRHAEIDALEDAVSAKRIDLAALEAKFTQVLKVTNRKFFETPQGKITLDQKWRVNLPKTPEDKSAFWEYLKEKGIFEELITVNSNTLNSYYKQEKEIAIEEGRGIDFRLPGIGAPSLYETIKVKKGK